MKTGLMLLTALMLMMQLSAQSFLPLKDVGEMQKKVAEASLKTNTIQCDFTQEKTMSMLTEKLLSKGRFYFERNNKVRLEYTSPAPSTIVMNGGKLLVKDSKKTTLTDIHKNRAFQQLNNIIVGSINGNLFSSKDFNSKFYESATQWKVEMVPGNKTMRNFISTIVIVLEKKDCTATRIEMNEPGGDSTVLSFTSKELNKALNSTVFSLQ